MWSRGSQRALLASVVCVLVVTGTVAVSPAVAVTPGSAGPIVYAMYGPSGSQQLFTSMPGGEPVPVPGTEGARGARWSPDGRVLAYEVWGQGIMLINPDGSGKRVLFAPEPGEAFGQPIWSPDGSRIAFLVLSSTEPYARIDIADSVDGQRVSVPTQLADVWEWLADGSFLGGAWRDGETGRNEEIGIQAPDGSLTYLTDTPDAEEGVPRLSPDGTRITFLSWRSSGIYSLGVMDRDGGNRHLYDQGTQVFWPAWSPNGSEIAIGPVPTGVRPDGTGAHPLTHGGGSGDGIDWAALVGTTTEPIPLVGIRTAALPDPSVRAWSSLSATSIWPALDGYRDTVTLTRRMAEPARAVLRIYNPWGTRIRQISYRFDTGIATYRWNGRSSTGVILAAGRYKLVLSWRDLAGNPRTSIQYVTLYRGYH